MASRSTPAKYPKGEGGSGSGGTGDWPRRLPAAIGCFGDMSRRRQLLLIVAPLLAKRAVLRRLQGLVRPFQFQ